MMARKSPAFSFYPDSWLGGTMRMLPEQRAAYIDLMANQWLEGPFTLETALVVCRGCSEKSVTAVLNSKFVCRGGLYCNDRLEEERQKQMANSDKQSKNGKKGGRPPKEKPNGNPNDNPNKSQTESQSISQKKPSDSDSDSVLGTGSNSVLDTEGEESPPARTGDLPNVPFGILQAWRKWEGFILESQGKQIGSIEAETTLMSLLRRGEEKAIRDIEFSIIKRCKTIRDSDNDFDRPRGGASGPTTFAQQRVSNTQTAIEEFANGTN